MLCALGCFIASAPAQSASVSVNAAATGTGIGAMHYGIFFEEINHAGNGGLWAELILNRSFENGNPLEGWTAVTNGTAGCNLTTDTSSPFNAYNVRELAVNVTSAGASASCGVFNAGFYNLLPITSGKTYTCIIYARKAGGFAGDLSVRIEDASGAASDTKTISDASLASTWTKFSFALTATRTLPSARLAITTQSTGTFYLTYVSLMPDEAVDGFRPDLLQKLKDLKPGFVRFPGGCYVEGSTLANAWQGKGGIGPQEDRRTFKSFWGYWDNDALGIYEYLILCEKLGAEPLFVANVGMSTSDTVTGTALQPYLQDALDAIQFANGDTNTTWGAQRAAMGHPAPFNLKYLEIGNENGGNTYNLNYVAFSTAIRSNYPAISLVANVWGTPGNGPVDVVDEHYYKGADWFAQNAHYYDTYSRTGPKVYVGEYAVYTSGVGLGNLWGALGEAMWMMGMERNADVVTMCSYAPLFANVNGRNWNPDMICFDASSSYGTPSYYVQQMMSENRGDINLNTTASGPLKTVGMLNGGVGVGTYQTVAEFGDVLVTNGATVLYQSNFANNTAGWSVQGGSWAVNNGNLRQSDANYAGAHDDFYAKAWTNYTLTVKARKISGNEGFLVLFRVFDRQDYYWWNLGGWGNTESAVERAIGGGSRSVVSPMVSYSVQTNVWYYFKIVAQSNHYQCYVRTNTQSDYTLIHDFYDSPTSPGFDAVAARDETSGDILLKVVNRTTNTLVNTPIVVTNAGWPSMKAIVTTLTSASDTNENSLADPMNVSPAFTQLAGLSPSFNYTSRRIR